MRFYIFRNHTIEHLFKHLDVHYSGYSDISIPEKNYATTIWFYIPSINFNENELLDEIDNYAASLKQILSSMPSNKFLIFLLSDRFLPQWSITNRKIIDAVRAFNDLVIELSAEQSAIQFIPTDNFFDRYSPNDVLNWKYYFISDMIINPKLASAFQHWFTTQTNALSQKRKKCLVLDLDNTLWGGVLGEDGIEGIKLGNTYPGRSFLYFQKALLEASKNGVILTVCSKNNEADVLEVWDKNPYILLKREHFAAYRINWQSKAQNIVEIADELNIGLDSMVFIDDNPAERELVKQNIPEVIVPDFPAHTYELVSFFQKIYADYFSAYQLTHEDKSKTTQYLDNTKRKIHQQNFVSKEAYLLSLQMELTVRFADKFTISRIAQMTQKTNQFNLTTNRYVDADIEAFINKGDIVMCLGVKDKFGDNGITVASIITLQDEEATIDTFLLSCRILGRGIEQAFINFMMNLLIDKNIKIVKSAYLPTTKNNQTKDFYDNIGFSLIHEEITGKKHYELHLTNKFTIPSYYDFK